MRADRLISILMLLQKNGRMKARQLALELEVSERTIYRDMEALSFSGVPIFAERGPGGGIELLDSYRSDLTGLNQDEVRALFMLGVPSHLADLGLDTEFKRALRKLTAALPGGMARDEERTRRFFIDHEPWEDMGGSTPFIGVLQKAVWEERPLTVTYRSVLGARGGPLEARINPYGLVAKDGEWYLVGQREKQLFVLALNRLLEAKIEQTTFMYPDDFSLNMFWSAWIASQKASQPIFNATVEISVDLIPYLANFYAGRFEKADSQKKSEKINRVTIKLSFSSFEEARGAILKLGGGIKVITPKALRLSVVDFARQVVSIYRD